MPSVPDSIPESDQGLIDELLTQKPEEFTELTQTQYEAFEQGVLDAGNHLLIAETGNGKTLVAEAVTKKALNRSEKVAYLVPSRALVTEKHATIDAWTGDHVAVETSGYKDADVIVATFESFFEAVIRGYTDRFGTVILDDFHEIYSSQRGPGIEKGISAALDAGKEILGISATIGNPHTIARWLDADLTISTEKRAVPIEEIPVAKTGESYADQLSRLIRDELEKAPFLVFNNSRRSTESRSIGVAETVSFDVGEDVDFLELVDARLDTELTDKHKELIRLLNSGIAYHHSGLEPELKDLIEEYTEEGVIKCVFCTTTLSYGFDSPVQSVIAADLKRWTGSFMDFIGTYEYVQWIGRAGRDPSVYDQAFAFPLYDDEEAFDRFQFDTRVEDKDIEDIESHLSSERALRWLVLELVNNGWEIDVEVLEFIRSTLYWSVVVDQIPEHEKADLANQPGDAINLQVAETLEWLTDHGLLTRPIGQPQDGRTRFHTTDLGAAFVEYEHSNWFDNSVESVLEFADWLNEHGSELTPERLIQRIGSEYHHCDLGMVYDEEGPVFSRMQMHDLEGSTGMTAMLVCWFWCAGVPLTDISDRFGEDLTELSNVTSHLSTALDSASCLFEPFEMPSKPEWLEPLAAQVEKGVPGPDMYLIRNTDYFGRKLYHALRDQLNRSGGSNSPWDPGENHYVIERLSSLLASSNRDQFLSVVRSTRGIGQSISKSLYESLSAWDPDKDERLQVPFAESFTDRPDQEGLVRYHEIAEELNTGDDSDDDSTQATTLTDF